MPRLFTGAPPRAAPRRRRRSRSAGVRLFGAFVLLTAAECQRVSALGMGLLFIYYYLFIFCMGKGATAAFLVLNPFCICSESSEYKQGDDFPTICFTFAVFTSGVIYGFLRVNLWQLWRVNCILGGFHGCF